MGQQLILALSQVLLDEEYNRRHYRNNLVLFGNHPIDEYHLEQNKNFAIVQVILVLGLRPDCVDDLLRSYLNQRLSDLIKAVFLKGLSR